MVSSLKNVTRKMIVGLSFVLLTVLLAACSISFGGDGSSATPTAAATPTAQPSPTTAAPVGLKTYTGTGFTIDYPPDWKVQTSGNSVEFQDALGADQLSIAVTPNPGGTASADTVATTTLQTLEASGNIKDSKPVTLPATTKVGGETWAQHGITGTAKINGAEVPGELIILADNHPANSPNTQTFVISYVGASATFNQTNSSIFQPMLSTFKFTA